MSNCIQPTFDFIEPLDPRRPKRPERVFTCIGAGTAAAEVAHFRAGVMRDNAIRGSEIPMDRLHTSMQWIGDFKQIPSRIVFGTELAAAKIVLSDFDVVLDRVVTFPGGRPGWFPTVLLAKSAGLDRLGETLSDEMRKVGLRAPPPARPHMTLFYSSRFVRPTDIEPIRFRVDRFYLIHSELGLTRYNVLGCWLLNGLGSATPGPLAFGSMAA